MQLMDRLEPRLLLAAGMLDFGYGAGGKLVAPILGDNEDVANVVAQQRDGRIVVAGDTYVEAYGKSPLLGVARIFPDGALDNSFGDHGHVVLTPPTVGLARPHASAVSIQRNGKILVGVIGDVRGIFMCRLNQDGSLDRAFGSGGADGDGWVSYVPPEQDADPAMAAVLVRRDGRIVIAASQRVVAGEVEPSILLFQYRRDGSPDTTFGDQGVRRVPLQPSDQKIGGAALLADGSIVVGGGTEGLSFLMRFDVHGNRDTAFDPLAAAFPSDFSLARSPIQSLLVQADGRIVIAGGTTVARLKPSGVLDSSFGNGRGFVTVDLIRNGIPPLRLHIQKNQRLIVTGLASDSTDGYVEGAVRLLPDGTPDPTFGIAGRTVFTRAPGYRFFNNTLLRRDGAVLGVGQDFGHNDFFLKQVHASGQIDDTFTSVPGGDAVYVNFRGPREFGIAAAVPLSDGRQVLVMRAGDETSPSNFRLVRLTHDGRFDPEFGPEGARNIDPSAFTSSGVDLAWPLPQGNGKTLLPFIYIAGFFDHTDGFAFTRLNADGTIDESFGKRGFVVTGQFTPSALTTDRLGRIVVADDHRIARYLADGRLDSSFGTGGIAQYSRPPGLFHAAQIRVEAAGRILIGGSLQPDPPDSATRILLMRIDERGGADTRFGNRGIVTSPPPPNTLNVLGDLTILTDGRILMLGTIQRFQQDDSGSIDSDAFLTRLTSDGRPDLGFGENGVSTVDVGHADFFDYMVIDRAGRIVIAGASSVGTLPAFVTVLRFTPDGRRDASFTPSGLSLPQADDDASGSQSLETFALSPNDEIVLAGHAGRDFFSAKVQGGGVSAYLDGRVLHVVGSSAPDVVRAWTRKGRVFVSGTPATFAARDLSLVHIDTFEGDDVIDCSGLFLPVEVDGGDGNDVLLGGAFADLVLGGAGHDTLFGGRGNDTLHGNDGNDYLNPGPGQDQAFGDAGNDQIFSLDNATDTLDGGGGFDRAKRDSVDILSNTEGVLA
jgi:uncharacterized delta-60 repeat protein